MIYFFLIIVVLHLLVLTKLIFFPYLELFIYPFLTNSGLLPYKDILDQHFPGLMFLPVNLNNLGMLTPADARVWQLGIVLITQLLLFITAKKVFKSEKIAICASIFYFLLQPLFEGWVLWIDSFVPLMLIPAFLFLHNFMSRRKNLDLFLCGFLLGIALVFKQVVLILIVVLFVYLILKKTGLKNLIAFSIGCLIPLSFMIAYMLKIGVWNDFIFWTVKFNLGTFAAMGRKYANANELLKTTIIFGIPVIISIVNFIKTKSEDTILLWIFFFSSLIFVYARFDYVHLQPALPFLTLIIAGLFHKRSRLLVTTLPIYLLVIFILLFKFYSSHIGHKVFFFGETESKLTQSVLNYTSKEDKIFAFGTTPHIYFLTGRLPAGNIFVFNFPWFLIEAEEIMLTRIIGDPPKLILRDKNSTVDGKNLTQYAPKINTYINKYYKEVENIDGIEILTRN